MNQINQESVHVAAAAQAAHAAHWAGIPTVILCGGNGVAFGAAPRTNKALIRVNGKPLFWWVILHYAQHGARQFLLAAGLQAERFGAVLMDELGAVPVAGQSDLYQLTAAGHHCEVRLVPTPEQATTTARLLACAPWLADAAYFCLSYSDTLSDVNLDDALRAHQRSGLLMTLVAARHPVRFRILGIRQGENLVRALAPRPVIEGALINGGFYVCRGALLHEGTWLKAEVPLEQDTLEALAAAQQLSSYPHSGAWQPCDAERDLSELERIARGIELASHSAA